VSFDPHPLQVVRPEAAPRLLTTATEKIEILAQAPLDYLALVRFTPALAAYSPRQFVEELLLRRLGMRHFVIGYDHGFGRGRSGDVSVSTLQAIGVELGFGVTVVEPVHVADGPISSTRIRRALEQGDVRTAAASLGRPYSLTGTVVRGEGAGRRLGFPTANLKLDADDKLLPHEGIYAARAALRDRPGRGVLHLGPRPTFPGLPPSIELHLFDFEGDLYGTRLRIDLVDRIRDVARFSSARSLIAAMGRDCTAARAVLAADEEGPGSGE
jgi:riboflavin kinase/FMN adenylyltransferase